jgi:hypothetical protein
LSTRRSTIVDNLAKFVHKHRDEADVGAEIVNDRRDGAKLNLTSRLMPGFAVEAGAGARNS